jgi:hypothetical protein
MLYYSCYLRKLTVYVPTTAKLATGAYTEIEPVAEVAITDTAGLRQAFRDTIARGNAIVPNPPKNNWPPPVLLKYAGVKSWSAFMRGAVVWSIKELDEAYQIVGHRVHAKGYWEEDPEQKIALPPGLNANDAIDRMIDILQAAARE